MAAGERPAAEKEDADDAHQDGAGARSAAGAAAGRGGLRRRQGQGVASLGGSDQPTSTTSVGGGNDRQKALNWARCMRQHGINTPDPKITADGVVQQPPHVEQPAEQKSPKLRAAEQACQQYLSNGGQARKPNAQEQQQLVQFARCVRQHGVNLPDPQITADGPELRYPRGTDPDDPRLKAAEQACQQYLPDTLGP